MTESEEYFNMAYMNAYKDHSLGGNLNYDPHDSPINYDKLLINDLRAEISAHRHNISVLEGEKDKLKSHLRLCVAEAGDRLQENKELLKKIEKLKVEVEKIHSRYEILDL